MTVVTLGGKVIPLPTLGTVNTAFQGTTWARTVGFLWKPWALWRHGIQFIRIFWCRTPHPYYSTGSYCLPPKLQGSSAGMLGSSTRLVSISVRLCLLDFIQKPEMLCFQLTRARLSSASAGFPGTQHSHFNFVPSPSSFLLHWELERLPDSPICPAELSFHPFVSSSEV